jgi:hypothetical protein
MGQIVLSNKLAIAIPWIERSSGAGDRREASFPVAERPSLRRSVVMPDSGASALAGPARTRQAHFILPSFVLCDIFRACRRRNEIHSARGCHCAHANIKLLLIDVKAALPQARR